MPGCRPGDIARIIASASPNRDKLVEVLWRRDFRGEPHWECRALQTMIGWEVRNGESVPVPPGGKILYRDSQLQPLRDQPGQDETLSWKSVPVAVKKNAPSAF